MTFDELTRALPKTVHLELPVTYVQEKDGITANVTLAPGVVSSIRYEFKPLPTEYPSHLYTCVRMGLQTDIVRAYRAWLQQGASTRDG